MSDAPRPRRFLSLWLLCFAPLWMAGCSDLGSVRHAPADTSPPPVVPEITRLVPERTFPGDTLTVQGGGFGVDQGPSQVLFSAGEGTSVTGSVVSWSDGSILVLVPEGVASGPLTIHTAGSESDPKTFTVAPEVSFSSQLIASPTGFFNVHGCEGCHFGGGTFVSNLDLTSYRTLMRGDSFHGPVVRPRDSEGSLIIMKLRGTTDIGVRMPQGGPYLSDDEILPLADWIDQGARDN
jgi:hypothetical protein